MYSKIALTSLSLLAAARAQQAGTLTTETHPTLNIQTCATGGTCTTQSGKIVLDSNWRWLHSTTGSTNCYTGNTWDTTLCPDATTCAANCALDGADYSGTYGITTATTSLTLDFVTQTPQGANNIGSRVYLMTTDTSYREFNLLNNEFTFDVDVSKLPCGLNGALYFTQMDADGGMAKHPTNKAGAKYGTGYCDAQCPQDLKFINGVANNVGWTPDAGDPNSGTGTTGACCTEMDIWEANINDQAYTPHLCQGTGLQACTSNTTCGNGNDRYDGLCDKDGCDFNPYRLGNTTFFGAGDTVDSSKPFTVVTQFITADGTSTGALSKIARIYVQNGKVIQNAYTNVAGIDTTNAISDTFCNEEKTAFGDTNYWKTLGGMSAFSKALQTPMVLVMSIWDDHTADMNWLDSSDPAGGTAPGNLRGPCDPSAGVPATVEAAHPNAAVTFSNIKFGPIGSTFSGSGSGTPTGPGNPTSSSSKPPTSSPTNTGGGTVPKWGQCGGQGYTGPTTCASGSTCTYSNPYYSQCL